MRKSLLLAFVFITSFSAFGQNYSNKGKDFWICYPEHVNGTQSIMGLYITSDVNTTGTISINGSNVPFTVTANNIQPRFLNSTGTGTFVVGLNTYVHLGNLQDGIKTNAAIHVTSVDPVVVYAHIIFSARSGSSLILPTNVWGKEYIVPSYANSGGNAGNQGYGEINIMASLPNTVVEITPQITTRNGARAAGVPYQITLDNPGDVYQVQFPQSADMSGTLVKSIASGASGCKPIAVFSGTTWTALNCGSGSGGDNLYQQLFPYGTWGKEFFTTPLKKTSSATDHNVDVVRVYVKDPATVVQKTENGINTILGGLNIGNYYEYSTEYPTNILADKPIQVMQYIKTQACNAPGSPATQSDPEMIALSSVEQTINDITVYSSIQSNVPGGNSNVTTHYINVTMKSANTGTFKINGATPGSTFTPIPGTVYSYLKQNIPISTPVSRLTADSGFSAVAYGFGNVESYGYNAGTSVKDLNTRLEISNPNSVDPDPSACTNSPFQFKVYFPDSTNSLLPIRYDSIQWEVLNNAANFVPNNFPVMVRPTLPDLYVQPDSVNLRNGKYVAWYSLPGFYYVNAPGVYPIRITLYRSSSEGCGNSVEYPFDLTVTNPPTASFTAPSPGCYLEPVIATETTPQIPKATYKLWWEFYDPVTNATTVYTGIGSAFRTISHTFTTPGTIALGTAKRIRHASITTPGCLSDTIVQFIELPDNPFATIAGTTAVCVNATPPTITFTGTEGTPGYTFTYTINGGAPQTVSSLGSSTTATVTVPTTASGVFTYNLVSVNNTGSVVCTRPISGQSAVVTVNPLPTASISGTISVCQNAPSPLITFTGAAGTAPYTFTYNINGGGSQVITTAAGNSVTIPVPTNVPGTFTYNLESVLDASSTLCTQAQGGSAVVTVNPLPTAGIAGTTSVCKNAASPLVTFTGADGTAPYTFTYNINGGANQTITTTSGNSVTIAAPTNVVGTFTYNLVSVLDASSTLCTQAQSGSAVITVNDLPTASIAGTITVCLNAPSPNITFTGANTSAPYTFSYTINSGPVQTVTTVSGNSVTVPVPTNVAGTFTYDLVSVQDGSPTSCSQAQSGSAVVVVNPLPTASIAGNTTVCLNSASPLVTFTGAVGTAPYTFTYNINGGANQTITTVAGNSVTVAAPTNVAGTFTYNLVSVQEGSANACSQAQGGSVVITVNDLPTASISGTTQVCLNAPSPDITFTGASTTAPYTFTYNINGGANQTVSTVSGNSVTVSVPTGVAGTFTYTLVSVQDGSSTTCSQAQAGSAVVTVHPLPTAAFNFTIPTCDTRTITFTDNSNPNVGTLTGWAWDFGDPASGGANTSNATNPTHVFTAANTTPGYNVTLTVTTSNGCSNPVPVSNIVVVNHRPEAGFIVPDVCINDVATVFTDTSKIAVGTINRPLNEWNFGDPGSGPLNNQIQQNGSHLYPAPGIYQVRQIVTSALGCKDTIILPITINSADPVSNFTVTNSCSSDSVDLRNLSTVGFGNVTRLDIYWDFVGAPLAVQTINSPAFNGIYRHKYPTLQTTQTYTIRMVAYSGVICSNISTKTVTVYATPKVQFNNIPATCYLVAPFQITQGSEIGGVPGTGTYSGPGITNPNGTFNPQVAGIGTHAIKYTWTASNPGACIDTLTQFITVLDTAHAAFSVTLPSCEQTPTLFTNLSTAPASVNLASTVWDFGDASGPQTFPIAAPISHLYAGPGTYTVTMHNVSAAGCLSTDTSAVITIDANHGITWDNVSGNENQSLCINNNIVPIRYTLSGGASGVTVTGLPAGVTYSVTGTTLTITGAPSPAAGGPLFPFTIVTTGNTCVVANASGSINVLPDHTISLAAGSDTAQSVCVNTPIDDIVYNLGGGATGVTISNLPPGVTYNVVGNILTITGTPTSSAGGPMFNFAIQTTGNACVKANTIGEILVNDYPIPAFAFDKTSYCIPNANVGFINNTTPAPLSNHTYSWEFGDGGFSTAASPTHLYTSEGPFNVKLKARSTVLLNHGVIGCESNKVNLLNIIHPQPKADFVFSKPSVCVGDNVTLTDATDGKDGLINQWHWDMGDGVTKVTNPVTYTFADTITYTVTMYSVNSPHGCNSDTISKTFTVYPYPTGNAGTDKYVLEGGSVELDATAYGREPQYTWTPVEYLTDSKILRPRVVNPKTDMTYRLTITGKGGCQYSDVVFVKLLKFPAIPNTFTPNGDGINDQWRIDYLNTYPDNRVQIFTRAGKLVFESRGYNKPWDGTLKGKPLPFDTYYYIIEPGNGRDPITGYVTILK